MRKVQGVKSLMAYFDSVNYPMTKENLIDLMARKEVLHISPISVILLFELNHIDWWIKAHIK
ncbi:hypothetical protein MHH33_10865 [Paenisporosarcina sp. FSL H8-0542]|uniref:hypothetical protein n=1 Tax=unclassified Paenisporosarcina TaxID=2642018 RepID=UPI00034E3A80|nr:hypothetical protein [Paenisporosarcina sp. HGH0030]EPD53242.1 hypothetical protein HMPREF1210_00973 [Paenisporosarcina sp. HGH0030]